MTACAAYRDSASRNWFLKRQSIRRIYDPEEHCLVYVAATSRASQSDKEQNSRFRTSIAVVPLEGTACKREDVLAGGQAEAAAAE